MKTVKQKLLSRVKKVASGCWEWQRALRNGYGAFKVDRKLWGTHRLSYTIFKGKIPDGLLVCHSCDNRKCVNPKHLFLGTHKDNTQDCLKKGRLVIDDGRKFENGRKPENRGMSEKKVIEVKQAIIKLYPSVKLKEIATMCGVTYDQVKELRRTKQKAYHNG